MVTGYMDRSFAFKHWIFTNLIAPVGLMTYIAFAENEKLFVLNGVGFLVMAILFSFVMSVPVFILYYGAFYFLSKKKMPLLTIRIVLSVIAIIGVFASARLLGGKNTGQIELAYSITVLVLGFLIKIRPSNVILHK